MKETPPESEGAPLTEISGLIILKLFGKVCQGVYYTMFQDNILLGIKIPLIKTHEPLDI